MSTTACVVTLRVAGHHSENRRCARWTAGLLKMRQGNGQTVHSCSLPGMRIVASTKKNMRRISDARQTDHVLRNFAVQSPDSADPGIAASTSPWHRRLVATNPLVFFISNSSYRIGPPAISLIKPPAPRRIASAPQTSHLLV